MRQLLSIIVGVAKFIGWILLAPFKFKARQRNARQAAAVLGSGLTIREYKSANQYKRSAHKLARIGWRVTSATVERRNNGWIFPFGGSTRYVVTYEKRDLAA